MSLRALSVYLGDYFVGNLTLLSENRSIFSFDDAYAGDPLRPVLSQSYFSVSGNVVGDDRPSINTLPNWFSNLLPEGRLRDYLAQMGGIASHQEFKLLELLGSDLPGAVRIIPEGEQTTSSFEEVDLTQKHDLEGPLRFSLAGVQLKFSAVRERQGGMTIPAYGIGGDWIVKLPSEVYPQVPENEEAMLTLAEQVGISVPIHFLIPIEEIRGLPDLGSFSGQKALVVKRFDRLPGCRVHMEDFAQVFGIPSGKKYEKVGTARIAEMIFSVMGEEAVQDFIGRLVFVILTGNGDMHLKNWSLLYPNGRTPVLSPAYDLLSTIPYIPADKLALNFMGEKAFGQMTLNRFRSLAQKVSLSEARTILTVQKMSQLVREKWPKVRETIELQKNISDKIDQHMKRLSI